MSKRDAVKNYSSNVANFSLKDKYEKSSDSIVAQNVEVEQETNKEEAVEEKKVEIEKKEVAEDPNELGAKLMRAELMGDEVKLNFFIYCQIICEEHC